MSFGFVSNFGFRILVLPWRPLRLCASHRLSETLNPNSTENFKYVWLDLRVLLGSGIETVDVPTVIELPKVMKIPHHQRVEILNLWAHL